MCASFPLLCVKSAAQRGEVSCLAISLTATVLTYFTSTSLADVLFLTSSSWTELTPDSLVNDYSAHTTNAIATTTPSPEREQQPTESSRVREPIQTVEKVKQPLPLHPRHSTLHCPGGFSKPYLATLQANRLPAA